MDIRCGAKLHGVLLPGGIIEIKCDSRFCKESRDTIVLHHFNVVTGELVETLRFKNPERSSRGSRGHRTSVRTS